MITTIIGMLMSMAIHSFSITYLSFLQLFTSQDVSTHGPSLEYWSEQIAIGLGYVTFVYSTWILYGGVPGFTTDCPYDVWHCGLTTCLQHVNPILDIWFWTAFGL